jgi:hypothetical protein
MPPNRQIVIPIVVVGLAAVLARLEVSEATSVVILALIAMVCWRVFQLRRDPGAPPFRGKARIWLLISCGFAYLALDEAFSFHERIDGCVHRFFSIDETSITDHGDDLIVLLYGIAGAIVLIYHRSELKSLTAFRGLLALGLTR